MRLKYLLLVLCVCLVFFSILLFKTDEESLKIISSSNIYSFKKSSNIENFKIDILMNDSKSYYKNIDYIDSVHVYNSDELIPLTIEKLHDYQDVILFDGVEYSTISLYLKVDFQSDDLEINLNDSSLKITYVNGEIIDFFIGDFNYLFDSSNNDDLSLGNLKATVMDTDSKKSISGLMISLTNNTTNSIIINEIQLGNDKVTLNNDYSIEMNREVDMFEEVEDILLKDYNNLSKQFNPNTHSIRSKEEKAFYIPVRFDEQHLFIHRTYIKISYNYRGVDKVLYLDDFPFINTSIFERGYIDGFNYYEYQDK